jgi:hypothetical protein
MILLISTRSLNYMFSDRPQAAFSCTQADCSCFTCCAAAYHRPSIALSSCVQRRAGWCAYHPQVSHTPGRSGRQQSVRANATGSLPGTSSSSAAATLAELLSHKCQPMHPTLLCSSNSVDSENHSNQQQVHCVETSYPFWVDTPHTSIHSICCSLLLRCPAGRPVDRDVFSARVRCFWVMTFTLTRPLTSHLDSCAALCCCCPAVRPVD